MGCGTSSTAGDTKNKSAPANGKDQAESKLRLLDEYSVGAMLGQGAYGVVSACKKRSTGEEYAVKMVDKVETPVDQIRKEAEMLKSLDHPNIVKFHGVYYERCFVCIVMDKMGGGDLVEGLQRHNKERGQIHAASVIHVAYQMAASLQYLHNRSIIHRDVKGDNYLMDRPDMTDLKCLIVLTDFGTACSATATDRLSAAVGTKLFWPPEFFDHDYGHKVDVWAMGVIMYGLVSGRFPFRDENDIRNKEVKVPKRVHPVCEEYIKKLLEKDERNRVDSTQAINHPWIVDNIKKSGAAANLSAGASEMAEVVPAANAKDDDDHAAHPEGLREDNVNDGIKERREELIKRLNKENELRAGDGRAGKRSQTGTTNLIGANSVKITDKQVQGQVFVYEWWGQDKVASNGLLDHKESVTINEAEVATGAADLKLFGAMLQEHNIDVTQFGKGKAKNLEHFVHEIQSGAARLMLDATQHKTLVRVVDVVLLRLRPKADPSRILIEVEERFNDGRRRDTLRLPGTKKEPFENMQQTAERILKEMLSIDPNIVDFTMSDVDRHEEEGESPSYPGVRTVYRKEIVEGIVSDAASIGLPSLADWSATDAKEGNTKYFNWMTDAQAEGKKVKLKPKGAEAISALVRAPLGMNEEALAALLKEAGHDVSKWGRDGTKTLKQFSAELIKGEASLAQGKAGEWTRIVDVVQLVIKNPASGETLVQAKQIAPDGTVTLINRLPGALRRPDLNAFLSARRVIKRQLELDENLVRLDKNIQVVEEQKALSSYPGLKTVYRKRLIAGNVFTPKTR